MGYELTSDEKLYAESNLRKRKCPICGSTVYFDTIYEKSPGWQYAFSRVNTAVKEQQIICPNGDLDLYMTTYKMQNCETSNINGTIRTLLGNAGITISHGI